MTVKQPSLATNKFKKKVLAFLLFFVLVIGLLLAYYYHFNSNSSTQKEEKRKSVFVNDGKIHITLDAGHGGPDPGAYNKKQNIFEKDVTRKIVDALIANADTNYFTILQTRPADSNIHRHVRMELSREFKTDLLISVHSNSFFQAYVNGFEIGYSDSSLDYSTKDSISKINPYKQICAGIADTISKNIGYVFPQMKNRGMRVRKDRIWMIYAGDFPSILVEWGYISNKKDLAIMQDSLAQQFLAKAIWHGIHNHFNVPFKE